MKRTSILFALGGALVGAALFRKQTHISVSININTHGAPKPADATPAITINVPEPVVNVNVPPPMINMPQPPPMVVNMGPTINNEIIDYPDERFLKMNRIENEPMAEEFLLEITELIGPHMGPDRANSLRSLMRVMHVGFIKWARELYKLPSN